MTPRPYFWADLARLGPRTMNVNGSPFCGSPESIDHLFFSCLVAKVIWGVIAKCFHQRSRPSSYDQYWVWITNALPGGENVHMLGLPAVCWAIWKAQNRVCFNRKPLKHVSEIVFSTLAFMNYWAGLHPEEA
jgi:hypothetical protein